MAEGAPAQSPTSSKEKKLDSFSKHANLFQSLFQGHSSLHASTTQLSARNPRELEKTQDELRAKYSRLERENLEKIWDEFDVNKDGQLSKAENEALVREYFNTMASWFPNMMDELLTQSLGFLDKSGASAPQFEKMNDSMQPLYNEMFESVQKDVPQMAEEMWGHMDLNNDGKVVKEEFLTTFDSCSDDIVNRITRRVLYCIFAMGNINFAKFISDVDKDTPNTDEQPPDADALVLEDELKGKFNEAVRDTAREELQKNVEPCSTDEFWHKVCTRIRGWLGGLNQPMGTPRGLGEQAGPFGAGAGGFNQFNQFGLQQQQLTPELFAHMQQQMQLQQAQLQQAQAAAQAAQSQAAQASAIAAQAQAQAQAAIQAAANIVGQQQTTTQTDKSASPTDRAGSPAGMSPAAAAHFAATQAQTGGLPPTVSGAGGAPFPAAGMNAAGGPFGGQMGGNTFAVPPPFPTFGQTPPAPAGNMAPGVGMGGMGGMGGMPPMGGMAGMGGMGGMGMGGMGMGVGMGGMGMPMPGMGMGGMGMGGMGMGMGMGGGMPMGGMGGMF